VARTKAERAKIAAVLVLGAALAALTLTMPAGGAVDDLGRSIPRTVGGWEANGPDRVFDRTTLYDYMDGGAEVFLAFDFREVWTRTYVPRGSAPAASPAGPEPPELTLDVYDMGSPAEAFGIFSCDREDPDAGIGQDSEAGFGLLRFRQGRYFVTVTASAEDEAALKAVLEIGRAALPALGPPGPRPAILDLLPPAGLRPERTSFFHSNVNLNTRFFISSENILNLDRSTDCAFAEYDRGPAPGEPVYLLLVRYPDAPRAAAARRSFLAGYLPEADPDGEGAAQTEDKKWVLASLRCEFVVVIFNAPDVGRARSLAAAVRFPER
jgi:hypothetical protein